VVYSKFKACRIGIAWAAVTIAVLPVAGAAATGGTEGSATPSVPTMAEILKASGLTVTGYVDGTYSYVSQSPDFGPSQDTNTFALNQAAATIGYLPSQGFGVLVNAVIGTEACDGCYSPGYGTAGAAASTSSINLLQGYIQYVGGKATVLAGKFLTLAGAEGAVPTTNANVTRSLLFWYSEPTTHVGVRLAYAASDMGAVTLGVNNGWNNDSSVPNGGKTAELSLSLTPTKAFTLAATGYYGAFELSNGAVGNRALIDMVGSWSATSALTIVINADWNQQDHAGGPGTDTAHWYGIAGYLNFTINPKWRSSLRLEYLDDADGFLFGSSTKAREGTLTLGYMPTTKVELRPEVRYDAYVTDSGSESHATQVWLQALYKF